MIQPPLVKALYAGARGASINNLGSLTGRLESVSRQPLTCPRGLVVALLEMARRKMGVRDVEAGK